LIEAAGRVEDLPVELASGDVHDQLRPVQTYAAASSAIVAFPPSGRTPRTFGIEAPPSVISLVEMTVCVRVRKSCVSVDHRS
jgi:hypothetical protein